MNLARIIGHATATVKHPAMTGWKLLVAQPLDHSEQPDGVPLVVIDNQGTRRGDTVMITSDGAWVREIMGTKNTPVRWAVLGLRDE